MTGTEAIKGLEGMGYIYAGATSHENYDEVDMRHPSDKRDDGDVSVIHVHNHYMDPHDPQNEEAIQHAESFLSNRH